MAERGGMVVILPRALLTTQTDRKFHLYPEMELQSFQPGDKHEASHPLLRKLKGSPGHNPGLFLSEARIRF